MQMRLQASRLAVLWVPLPTQQGRPVAVQREKKWNQFNKQNIAVSFPFPRGVEFTAETFSSAVRL